MRSVPMTSFPGPLSYKSKLVAPPTWQIAYSRSRVTEMDYLIECNLKTRTPETLHHHPRTNIIIAIFTRESIYAICLIRVLWVKTAERIMEILYISDRPIILVFRHQGFLPNSDGFTEIITPKGGAKYKGVSNFRPICGYISETVI